MLKEDNLKYYSQDMTFSHLMMGFPIMKGWGVTAAILPFSNGAYDIGYTSEGSGVTGSIYEHHNGTGGYQKALLGTGIRPLPFVSVGANVFYMFGEVTRINDFVFTGDNNYFNTRKQATRPQGDRFVMHHTTQFELPEKQFINAASLSLFTQYDNEIYFRYSSQTYPGLTPSHSGSAPPQTDAQSVRAGFPGQVDKRQQERHRLHEVAQGIVSEHTAHILMPFHSMQGQNTYLRNILITVFLTVWNTA